MIRQLNHIQKIKKDVKHMKKITMNPFIVRGILLVLALSSSERNNTLHITNLNSMIANEHCLKNNYGTSLAQKLRTF